MTSSHPLPVRLSPRPVRALLTRIARSSAAADLRAAGSWPWLCALILLSAAIVGVASGDYRLGWDGLHPISPADLYTGTDAGLLPADAGR